jgi:hypothetical protein
MLRAMSSELAKPFIARWAAATASERANSQPFLCELCDVLGVARPEPTREGGYAFEFEVTEQHADGSTSQGRIDLYRRGCFVLESKQFQAAKAAASQLELAAQEAGVIAKKKSSQPVRGTGAWDDAMVKARGQAERYVRALPANEPNPAFLLVVDVGHSIEVFADFTQAGRAYLPFPDPRTFRVRLEHLADEKARERLRLIWTNPAALDPARQSADVTREISAHLAELAKSLELAGHRPRVVADFLTRCLFCMFAEDVGLLPERSFTDLLDSVAGDGAGFRELVEQLFREMNSGTGQGISIVLRKKLLQFNGGLFSDFTVLPVNGLQLGLLKEAAKQNWSRVEPAIFGTLLERALNPGERHKLGAHYTPRAYVERLVLPTVVEPLRAEWESVRTAAFTHARAGNLKKARDEVNAFHDRLCQVIVLDPACGCGNFLYVSLEHLKRLEGEVLDVAAQFGESFTLELATHSVDPHQFLGLEINPRAAAITELVLWIGYLQWHFRTRGQTMPAEPVLRKFKNIECRDAVLAYDGEPEPARDQAGSPVTVWDRKSTKKDPVTGRDVPDETKRVPLLTYKDARPAEWPAADYVIGNPPFLGATWLRTEFGDGYAESLRATYPEVPESVDFVLYWWHKAAELVRAGKAKRFGFITTNSVRQSFGRRVIQPQLEGKPPISLVFAIPDHPWVDTAEGAAVRIAMTTGTAGEHLGELLEVTDEQPLDDGSAKVTFVTRRGKIQADLTVGANVAGMMALKANDGLACPGVKLHGSGFIVTPDEAKNLGLGQVLGLDNHIRQYRNGKDLTDEPRGVMVIDLFGLTAEEVRERFPAVYQRVLTRVKPERDANNRATYRDNWWVFGEPRGDFRPALVGLRRYVATVETSRHRTFQYLTADVLPDNKLVVIALDDAFHLGVLSSRVHVVYSLAAGGWLGVGNDPVYAKSRCFDPFPFPICDEAARARVRRIAEELDAHRKRVQVQNPGLTLTGMYNVLERLRSREALSEKERRIHDAGLVSVLRQLHDDLDAAVFAAYGWPASLTDAEILDRLVALNGERSKEEASGMVRWLRPAYQNPGGAQGQQGALAVGEAGDGKHGKSGKKMGKLAWPKTMAERVMAVSGALAGVKEAVTAADVARGFSRAKAADVGEILETLCAMGRAHKGKVEGTYLP